MMDVRPCRSFALRTMIPNTDRVGLIVSTGEDDPRITRARRRFRKRSRDELPQLSNILMGHMSFVGPCSALAYHGWAQVNRRNSLTQPERIQLDVWYVEHRSLWLDLRILLKTVWVVLRREGIYGPTADEILRTDGLPRGM